MAAQPSEHLAIGYNVGDVLAGKYRIEKILGVGGMGVVVAAMHIQLDERVAIKFLLPEALGNAEAVARFAREARAAVKIKSEHVARVTDVGTLDNGTPYMVMEYLEGSDLSVTLERHGTLPVADTVTYVLQACEAIVEAHAIGIVHRDLKPANLFLMRRTGGADAVKVLDFGISKMADGATARSGMALTGALAMMGSPLYMSPEQMTSARDVDAGTDIWALGAILYELITGKPPFDADTIPQLCAMILQAQPAPMGAFRTDLPAGIEAVVLRCLEKDRTRRYANVGELAVALLEFAPKRGRLSAERIVHVIRSAGGATIDLPPSMQPPASAVVAKPGERAATAKPVEREATAKPVEAVPQVSSIRVPVHRTTSLVIGGVLAACALVGLGAWMLSRGAAVPQSASSDFVVRPAAEPPAAEPAREAPAAVPQPVAQPVAVQPVAVQEAVAPPVAVQPMAPRVAGSVRRPRAAASSMPKAPTVEAAVASPATAQGPVNPSRHGAAPSPAPVVTITKQPPGPKAATQAASDDDDLYGTRK